MGNFKMHKPDMMYYFSNWKMLCYYSGQCTYITSEVIYLTRKLTN